MGCKIKKSDKKKRASKTLKPSILNGCGCHVNSDDTTPAYIGVTKNDIAKMKMLGYKPVVNQFNNESFIPKTVISKK